MKDVANLPVDQASPIPSESAVGKISKKFKKAAIPSETYTKTPVIPKNIMKKSLTGRKRV